MFFSDKSLECKNQFSQKEANHFLYNAQMTNYQIPDFYTYHDMYVEEYLNTMQIKLLQKPKPNCVKKAT